MAIEALDTVGSSLTTLGAGFTAGVSPKARKIGILAFEVANTVVKGFDLMQTLSEDGIKMLKDEILSSEGIQHLISKDMDVLWGIVAADKRNQLRIYIQEVVRFGNHCRDPRWHQLSRFFERFEHEVVNPRLTATEMEVEMDRMTVLAQDTAELYHELHALDRLRNDLYRKLQQKGISNEQGEIVALLKSDVKSQFKHVKILKKRCLWSKILEEVMESLVNIAFYLHQQINDEFGPAGVESPRKSAVGDKEFVKGQSARKLGDSGLSLHYANMINQIHNLASRPSSIPPSSRDTLYQGLPPHMKVSLRVRLSHKSEVTVEQIKVEMETILEWLVPLAINTTRAHHGFGWVGEWAMKGVVLDRKLAGNTELALIQTLHHADQAVTEAYISDLIVCLHLLVSSAKKITSHKSPNHSPMQTLAVHAKVVEKSSSNNKGEHVRSSANLSQDDQEMLQDSVNIRKRHPGISKSQEFDTTSKFLYQTLSKSNSLSPGTSRKASSPRKRRHSHAFLSMDLDIDRIRDFEKDSSGKIYHC
ncbi:hypothetical protein O6H91_05G013800 [Diphasiastrum complanatum]|nr:hypothetical protein O6H91_05G013800 [Diphasiastrum complanatum]